MLPTQQVLKPPQLPGATDPPQRFIEPWNSRPEMSFAEDLPENLSEALSLVPLKGPPNFKIYAQEPNVDITTILSIFGWEIRKPPYYIS